MNGNKYTNSILQYAALVKIFAEEEDDVKTVLYIFCSESKGGGADMLNAYRLIIYV
jgi:hypothetical protein